MQYTDEEGTFDIWSYDKWKEQREKAAQKTPADIEREQRFDAISQIDPTVTSANRFEEMAKNEVVYPHPEQNITDAQALDVRSAVNQIGLRGDVMPEEDFQFLMRRRQQKHNIGSTILNSQPPSFAARAAARNLSETPEIYNTDMQNWYQKYHDTKTPFMFLDDGDVRKAVDNAVRRQQTQNVLSRDDIPDSMYNFLSNHENFQLSFDDIPNLIRLKHAWDDLAVSIAPQYEGGLGSWVAQMISNFAHGMSQSNAYTAAKYRAENEKDVPWEEYNPLNAAWNWAGQKIDEWDAAMWDEIARATAPDPYLTPITRSGLFMHDLVTNMGFTLYSMAKNALIFATLLPSGGTSALGYAAAGLAAAGLAGVEGAWEESNTEAGGVYADAKARGWDEADALRAGDETFRNNMIVLIGPEILQNYLAFMGMPKLSRNMYRTARKFLSRSAVRWGMRGTSLLIGAASEGWEEFMQETITAHALGEEVNDGSRWWSAMIGAASGCIFHAGGTAFRMGVQRFNRALLANNKQANEDASRQRSADVINAIANTLTSQRAPAKAQEFIELAGERGQARVYVDTQSILAYYNSKGMTDMNAIAQDLGLNEKETADFLEAAQHGEDMDISAAQLSVKAAQDNEFYDAIRGDMKFDPDTLTENELKDVDQNEIQRIRETITRETEAMKRESAAVDTMISRLTEAFQKVFWPENVTRDGEMPEYFDAIAQLFAIRQIRDAQARGLSVEDAIANSRIEVVNDGNTVKIVMRRNATPTTETQTADAQTETKVETTPTPATDETPATPEATPVRDTSAKEAQIAKWKAELETARQNGDKKAIKNLQRKIKRAEASLNKAQTELQQDDVVIAEFEQTDRYEIGNRPPDLRYVQKMINGTPRWVLADPGQRPENYVPKKVGTAYKLMEIEVDKNGRPVENAKLKALFAGNTAYDLSEWLWAEGFWNDDIGVVGKAMNLAERFGWHLGTGLPTAPHLMMVKDMGYKSKRGKRYRRVWVEMQFDATKDFTDTAEMTEQDGEKMKGKKKDISGLTPFGGYYMFQEGNKSDWIISSGVRMVRLIPENENDPIYKPGDVTREQILREAGYSEELAWRKQNYSTMFTDAALEKLKSDPTKASEVEEFLAKKAENEQRIAELEADPSFKQHDLYTKITPEMRQAARQRILEGIIDNPDLAETQEFEQDAQTPREVKLNNDASHFASQIDAEAAVRMDEHGKYTKEGSGRQYFEVLSETPAVFELIGEDISLPMDMEVVEVFGGISPNGQKKPGAIKKHGISLESIKDIPYQLADPLLIYEAYEKRPGKRRSHSLVVVTEMTRKENGAVIVAALQLKKSGRSRKYNRIASVHAKQEYAAPDVAKALPAENWLKPERVRYIDDTRTSLDVLQQSTRATPIDIEKSPNADNIKTKRDLVNKWAELGNTHLQSRSDNAARGKSLFTAEETIIAVFERGDKSTMVHELGHVFLQELAKYAKMDGIDQSFIDDWNYVSNWLGVSDLDISKIRGEQDIKRWKNAQEKFAATFEAYLMEGKAPTPELQSVFRRFKNWLTNIYTTVKNIKWRDTDGNLYSVKINDEIRGFFDRLLVTREALEEQQAIGRSQERADAMLEAMRQNGQSEVLIDEAASRMAERLEEANESLASQFFQDDIEEERKEFQDEVNERIAGAREDIYEREPIYGIIEGMQRDSDFQLDYFDIQDNCTPEEVSKLMNDLRIVRGADGVPLSVAADAYGYKSVREFINALVYTEPLEDAAYREAANEAADALDKISEADIPNLSGVELFGSEAAIDDTLADAYMLAFSDNGITDSATDILQEEQRASDLFEEYSTNATPERRAEIEAERKTNSALDAIFLLNEEGRTADEREGGTDERFAELAERVGPLDYWQLKQRYGETADGLFYVLTQAFGENGRRKYIVKKNYTKRQLEDLELIDSTDVMSEPLAEIYGIELYHTPDAWGNDPLSTYIEQLKSWAQDTTDTSGGLSSRSQRTQRAIDAVKEVREELSRTGDQASVEFKLAEQLARAEQNLTAAREQNDKLTRDLKNKRDPNKKKVEQLTKEKVILEEDKRDLAKDLRNAERDIHERYKDIDAKNSALNKEIAALDDTITAMKKVAARADKRGEKRETVIQEQRKKITELTRSINSQSRNKEDLKKLRGELEAAKRVIKSYEKSERERANVNKAISDLYTRRSELLTTVRNLQKEAQRLNTKIVTLGQLRSFRAEQAKRMALIRNEMKDEARAMLASKPVSEATNAGKYIRQAEKWARKAEVSMRNGNFKAASEFKKNEAFNRILANMAANNQKTLARAKKFLSKMSRQIERTGTLKGIAPNYAKQIEAILERFNFAAKANDAATIRDVSSLSTFVRELQDAGEVAVIPSWVIEMTQSRDYRTLTMAELTDVHEAVRNLSHLGRVSDKILQAGTTLKISEIGKRLAEGLYTYYDKTRDNTLDPRLQEDKKLLDRIKSSGINSDFMASLELAEFICRAIDGYPRDENGHMVLGEAHQLIFQPIRDAISRETDELTRIHKLVDDMSVRVYGKKQNFDNDVIRFDIPLREVAPDGSIVIREDRQLELTRGGVIAAVLNMGNDGNRQRMMDGWKFTEAEMNMILNQLSKEDMDFVQGIWDIFESELWPMVASTHLLMTGVELRKVQARPLVTKHGVYRGGYYPIKVDTRYSEVARKLNEKQEISVGAIMSQKFEFMRPQTKDGHRIARQEKVDNWPPLLDVRVIDAHIGQVVHDSLLAPAVRDVHAILNNPDLKQAISDTLGSNRNLALNHWLRAVAQDNKNDGKYMNAIDRLMMRSRTGMIMMGLGANIAGGIMQVFGIFPLMREIGIARGVRAMFNGILNWRATRQFATERSAFMREQILGTDRDVRKAAEMWSTSQRKPLNMVQNALLAHYAFFQNLCNVPGWIEAYKIGLAKEGNTEADAIRYADSVIRTTQSAGSIADLTQMETSGTLGRLITMFYSWFRVMNNMNIETWRRFRNEKGGAHKAAILATHALFVLILPRMAEQLLKGARPDDDESWMKFLLTEGVMSVPRSIAESIPGVRDVAAYMTSDSTTYRFTPVQSAFESIFKLTRTIGKSFDDGWDNIDWSKVLNDSLDTFGYWGAVPVRGTRAIVSDMYDAMTSDQEWYSSMYRILTNDRKKKK